MRQFSFPSWRFRLGLLVVLTAMGVVGMWRNSHELVVASVTTLAAGWAGMDFLLMRRLRALVSATKRVATGEPEARTGLADEPEELGQLPAPLTKSPRRSRRNSSRPSGRNSTSRKAKSGFTCWCKG